MQRSFAAMNVTWCYFSGDLNAVRKYLNEHDIEFGHRNKRRTIFLREYDIHLMGLNDESPGFAPEICRVRPDERGEKQANDRLFRLLKKEFGITNEEADRLWKARTDERRSRYGFRLQGGYPLPDSARIDAAEKKLGLRFPETYRDFLMGHNGGRPDDDDFELSSVRYFLAIDGKPHHDLEHAWHSYSGRIPAGLLPIAGDPGGNLILIGLRGKSKGQIYFWDHEEEGSPEAASFLAASLEDFLASLHSSSPVTRERY